MAKAPRLKVGSPNRLKAVQLVAVSHPEGGDGLVMIDSTGTVYARTDQGWVAIDMNVATNYDEVQK